jgi:hypothetical protein
LAEAVIKFTTKTNLLIEVNDFEAISGQELLELLQIKKWHLK